MSAERPNKPKRSRQKAVALQYEGVERAPRVVASGAGEMAKKIIELAKEHKIPLKRDDQLVDILSQLDLNSYIPLETYKAVAEILAFLYRSDLAWQSSKGLE